MKESSDCVIFARNFINFNAVIILSTTLAIALPCNFHQRHGVVAFSNNNFSVIFSVNKRILANVTCDGKFIAHKDRERFRDVVRSFPWVLTATSLPALASIFTIPWRRARDLIALMLYCACMRIAYICLFGDVRGGFAFVGGTIRCALYWSTTTCIVCSRRSAYGYRSPLRELIGFGVELLIRPACIHTYTHIYTHTDGHRVTYSRGRDEIRRILPGKSSCSMITYYTARAPPRQDGKRKGEGQKNVSKSLL